MNLKRGRKGISAIITSVLIIIIAILAVFVIYPIIKNVLRESTSGVEDAELLKVRTTLDNVYLSYDDNKLQATITREGDNAEIDFIKIVARCAEKNSVYKLDSVPSLQSKTFVLDISGLSDCKEIGLIPFSVKGSPGVESIYEINIGDEKIPSEWIGEFLQPEGEDSEVPAGECIDGETKNCALQQGVCEGSYEFCINQKWEGCDESIYSAYSFYYQTEENLCDAKDNDCDGSIDEDCISSGYISWWELKTDANDKGEYNNDGVPAGNANFNNGFLAVDGTGDWITINAPVGLNIGGGDASYSIWVKTNVVDNLWRAGFDYDRGGNDAFGFYKSGLVSGYDKFHCRFGKGNAEATINSNTNFETGKWYHIACSYNKNLNEYKIYVNGILDKTEIHTPTAWLAVNDNMKIGANEAGTETFNGEMGDLIIYNKVLQSAEISNIYNSQKSRYEMISYSDYYDKAKGAWIGQFAGNFISLPYEGKWNINPGTLSDVNYVDCTSPLTFSTVNCVKYNGEVQLRANDDHSVEYMWLDTLETYGINPSYENIKEEWIAHMKNNGVTADNVWWCANWDALNLMLQEDLTPPETGSAENNMYSVAGKEAIDAQIETEIFGAMFPGMTISVKDKVGFVASSVTDGAEKNYAEFYAMMYSEAFFENDIYKIIDNVKTRFPQDSRVVEVVNKVKELYNADTTKEDWRDTRLTLRQEYWDAAREQSCQGINVCAWPYDGSGSCNVYSICKCNDFSIAEVNFAFTIMALLYSEGDFDSGVQIATLAGMDNDCNAATVGGLLGIISGYTGIPIAYKEPLTEDYIYINEMHPGLSDTDTVTNIVGRTVALGEQYILANEGRKVGSGTSAVYYVKRN